MSDYLYLHESTGGPNLEISRFEGHDIWVGPNKKDGIGSYIRAADVPTIAAELLKAARSEATILPKAYEDVRELDEEIACGRGPEAAYGQTSQNPNWLRNRASNYIALADYIENREQREAAVKERKLQERRDALLQEFRAGSQWDHTSELAQLAIDRIIELEDGKATA